MVFKLLRIFIEVKSGRRSAILNSIKLNFIMLYPYLKLFNSNGLAIWSGLTYIMHVKKRMADNQKKGQMWNKTT